MKPDYLIVADRFLADQGGLFRFHRNRWWVIKDGYWVRGDRLDLERALINYMIGYFPVERGKMNQGDMNGMCAHLSRQLTTSHLPARYLDADQDDRIRVFRPPSSAPAL